MKNSKEVIDKSKSACLSEESYLMLYHNIRWCEVDYDLEILRL